MPRARRSPTWPSMPPATTTTSWSAWPTRRPRAGPRSTRGAGFDCEEEVAAGRAQRSFVAERVQRAFAHLVVVPVAGQHLAEDHADRVAGFEALQERLGGGGLEVDVRALDADVAEQPFNVVGIAPVEAAVRPLRRLARRPAEHREHVVHRPDRLPGGDEGLAPRHPQDLLGGELRLLAEDHGEDGQDAVEGLIIEGEVFRLAHDELALANPFARDFEQARRRVHCGHPRPGLGGQEGGVAGPRAEVQHLVSLLDASSLHHELCGGLQLARSVFVVPAVPVHGGGLYAVRPAIPLRRSAAASSRRMTAATVRAWRSSQPRAACSTPWVRSRATSSAISASAIGNSDTSVKNSQSTTYCAALGSSSEMLLSASGMNPPGFASAAPAPTTAIAGDAATRPIWLIAFSVRSGFAGRRRTLITQPARMTAATTSTIATQVFGVDGWSVEAASPSTNAAATPTASVAVSAPM